jgi:hypothetical protein
MPICIAVDAPAAGSRSDRHGLRDAVGWGIRRIGSRRAVSRRAPLSPWRARGDRVNNGFTGGIEGRAARVAPREAA